MLNEADHTYTGILTKKPGLLSVTTILAQMGYIDKSHFRDGFTDLGKNVHKLIDAYCKGLKFRAPDLYLRYLEPVKMFLNHTKAEIVGSEIEGENPMLGHAGTLDWLVNIPSHGLGIMDIKVSSCGWIPAHEYQTEAYRQMLMWHPKYKDLNIKWRGGIILGPDCKMPKLIQHDRIPDISKIWQAICIVNADKHRHKIRMEEITREEGWYI